jgi:hypothetical protein
MYPQYPRHKDNQVVMAREEREDLPILMVEEVDPQRPVLLQLQVGVGEAEQVHLLVFLHLLKLIQVELELEVVEVLLLVEQVVLAELVVKAATCQVLVQQVQSIKVVEAVAQPTEAVVE